jgi:hypothetical protein
MPNFCLMPLFLTNAPVSAQCPCFCTMPQRRSGVEWLRPSPGIR